MSRDVAVLLTYWVVYNTCNFHQFTFNSFNQVYEIYDFSLHFANNKNVCKKWKQLLMIKTRFFLFSEGRCDVPALSSDSNYNRIIPNDTSVDFGTDVTIECSYGTGFRNLSLYCGESGVATYELLGDNLTCPCKE